MLLVLSEQLNHVVRDVYQLNLPLVSNVALGADILVVKHVHEVVQQKIYNFTKYVRCSKLEVSNSK